MFEKFSVLDVDSAGRGGEYTVQAGFGWTNGVLLWVAGNYGGVIDAPSCPSLEDSPDLAAGSGSSKSGAVRGVEASMLGLTTMWVVGSVFVGLMVL